MSVTTQTWAEVEALWDREAFMAGWAQAASEGAENWEAQEIGEALARYLVDGTVSLRRGAFDAGRLAGIAAAMGR